MGIILLAGIHGTSKSTTGRKMADRMGIEYIGAGKILAKNNRWKKRKQKIVNNIIKNQEILISLIQSMIIPGKDYILDGHFCLIDNNNNIRKIPQYIYNKIPVKSIVILVDSVYRIQKRLYYRDNILYKMSFLHMMQKEELKYGKHIASLLHVKCIVIDFKKMKEVINKLEINQSKKDLESLFYLF